MDASGLSKHQLNTSDGVIDYQLTRSVKRRRTMEVRIRSHGVIEVHAPSTFSIRTVENFLRSKSKWIIQKLGVFIDRQAVLNQRKSDSLKECFYLGKSYSILTNINNGRWGRIIFDERGWSIEIPERIKSERREHYTYDFMEKWFKSRALDIFQERVSYFGALMGEMPDAIRIRSPRNLWGSCHAIKRILHFNWRIIMAPFEVIDYLVVHEMSHLKIANHSIRFWRRVEQFCPEFKERQRWLKDNGYQLRLPFEVE